MSTLHQLIYISTATKHFDDLALLALMWQARPYNQEHGITGVLLHNQTFFAQCIEGEESEVRTLYKKICNDRRHSGVMTVYDQATEHRNFEHWSMGCTRIGESDSLRRANLEWSTLVDNARLFSSSGTAMVLMESLWDFHKDTNIE